MPAFHKLIIRHSIENSAQPYLYHILLAVSLHLHSYITANTYTSEKLTLQKKKSRNPLQQFLFLLPSEVTFSSFMDHATHFYNSYISRS